MFAIISIIFASIVIFFVGRSAWRDWKDDYEDNIFYAKLCVVAVFVGIFAGALI